MKSTSEGSCSSVESTARIRFTQGKSLKAGVAKAAGTFASQLPGTFADRGQFQRTRVISVPRRREIKLKNGVPLCPGDPLHPNNHQVTKIDQQSPRLLKYTTHKCKIDQTHN